MYTQSQWLKDEYNIIHIKAQIFLHMNYTNKATNITIYKPQNVDIYIRNKQYYTVNKECQSDSHPSMAACLWFLTFVLEFSFKEVTNLQFTKALAGDFTKNSKTRMEISKELEGEVLKDDFGKKGSSMDFTTLRSPRDASLAKIGFPGRILMIHAPTVDMPPTSSSQGIWRVILVFSAGWQDEIRHGFSRLTVGVFG